jgi:hypothetical protein
MNADDVYTMWLDFPEGEIAISADATKLMHALGAHLEANPLCSECRRDVGPCGYRDGGTTG